MRGLFAALVFLPVSAFADTQYWDYGAWTVRVERVDTGEDLRIFCTASTGGDGLPALRIAVSNGDALPPYVYPAPILHESAPRGYTTMMQDGQRVQFEFDRDGVTEGFVQSFYDEDGILQAQAAAHADDSLWLLQTMRHADQMWITRGGEVIYGASLAGFTASYGKIAEQCGFPTVGVIE
ncbi:hypothetical protein [Yoonia sp. I 8.24]|uniref:hypothetical protein n=1 Tax=Yoonia sp. I 8.24 TaxID=1537229 RepID=UPI001EDDFC4B|nr:hypothetical protein [Yoonia sp. I 8.24]MCG3268807.1 hypothetical protein [Yoonia sp. I 8.24]